MLVVIYTYIYISAAYTVLVFRGALLRLLAYCTLSALFGGGGSIFLFFTCFFCLLAHNTLSALFGQGGSTSCEKVLQHFCTSKQVLLY